MASLNNPVIGLLRHAGETNIAAARRQYDTYFTLALGALPARPITLENPEDYLCVDFRFAYL